MRHGRDSSQIFAVQRLPSFSPIPGFLIFVFPEATIAARCQIRRALLFEVGMLEIAVIR